MDVRNEYGEWETVTAMDAVEAGFQSGNWKEYVTGSKHTEIRMPKSFLEKDGHAWVVGEEYPMRLRGPGGEEILAFTGLIESVLQDAYGNQTVQARRMDTRELIIMTITV